MSAKIAEFRLGAMGYGIASSILRAGHSCFGFDLNPEPVKRFQNDGGKTGEIDAVAGPLVVSHRATSGASRW